MIEESDNGGDSRWRVHLEWMDENQPDFVRELSQHGKLRAHLDEKEQHALRYVSQLKTSRGMTDREAFEIAMAMLLAPADGPAMGDEPPEPVPWQEQETIWRAMFPDE